MAMKLVLRRNIPNLGSVGDVVRVSNGHARNYLLPRGLAYPVTQDNLLRLESEKKRIDRLALEEKARCETLASELDGRSFSIPMKATEEGHLYGSVDAAAVAGLLRAENIEVSEKDVRLEEPIKELGIYELEIQVHPEVTAKTKVWVVSDENPDESAKGEEASPETPEAG